MARAIRRCSGGSRCSGAAADDDDDDEADPRLSSAKTNRRRLRYMEASALRLPMYSLSIPNASDADRRHRGDACTDRHSSAASMTVHTALDMSSMRRRVDLAFRSAARRWSSFPSSSYWPSVEVEEVGEVEEEEREVTSVMRIESHSRMASFARRTKSVGTRRPGRPKRVAPPPPPPTAAAAAVRPPPRPDTENGGRIDDASDDRIRRARDDGSVVGRRRKRRSRRCSNPNNACVDDDDDDDDDDDGAAPEWRA